MTRDRRRYLRHHCAIKARLREQAKTSQLTTCNVSRHGVFVVTDSPKSERQLVRISFELPDGPLDVMGMVARKVTRAEATVPASGGKPGMGIDFFALSREDKDRWDRFVLAQDANHDADGPPVDAAVTTAEESASLEPTRRRHPRHVSCFLVRMRDRQRLRDYYSRDISAGGTLLRTPSPEEVAQDVDMILVHPETKAEFALTGRVVRVIRSATLAERGVAISFERLGPAKEAALLAFIETGVNYLQSTPEARSHKMELLRRAASLAPASALPLVALGQALLETDEVKLSVEAFERALALDPDCISAHRGLYHAYTALEAHSQAHRHLVIVRRHEKPLSAPATAAED